MGTFRLVALALALVTGCAARRGAGGPEGAADTVVHRFVQAFDRRDVDGLLALASPDVQWLAVEGDTVVVEADGRAALWGAVEAYWQAHPTARAAVERVMVAGPWITAWERATWEVDGERRTQRSLAVYEVREGRVARVWYYPAEGGP